jgi:hypothetical protein
LNTLNGKTSGTIDASKINVIEGTASDVNTLYDSGANTGFSGLGNEAITLTDTTVGATALLQIDTTSTGTTGTIDASSVHTLTGLIKDVNSVYASSDFTGLGAENVTLSDINVTSVLSGGAAAGSTNGVVVSTLNTLNDYTTGTINAATVTVLRGDAADLNTAYAAGADTGNAISGLGNEAVTTTDTSLAAATLTILNDYSKYHDLDWYDCCCEYSVCGKYCGNN